MSKKEYQEDCPGCRPVIVDFSDNNRRLPDDHPKMVILLKIWREASHAEKVAFHNVTCNSSRRDLDVRLARELMKKFQRRMNESDPKLS